MSQLCDNVNVTMSPDLNQFLLKYCQKFNASKSTLIQCFLSELKNDSQLQDRFDKLIPSREQNKRRRR